jgi:hypothetical protein
MSITRTIRRQFYKPSHRVTRCNSGFNLHRRFLRFFYRPVLSPIRPGVQFFETLEDVYDFVHSETGSDYICVELYPPGDFQSTSQLGHFLQITKCVNVEKECLRAVPPLCGPTGPAEIPASPGPTGSYRDNCGPGPAPSEDNSTLLVAGALLAAAVLNDDDSKASEAPAPVLDTNIPLERDSSPAPSPDSGGYDSSPASSYDSGSSCDSGSSSCDCGGGDC